MVSPANKAAETYATSNAKGKPAVHPSAQELVNNLKRQSSINHHLVYETSIKPAEEAQFTKQAARFISGARGR